MLLVICVDEQSALLPVLGVEGRSIVRAVRNDVVTAGYQIPRPRTVEKRPNHILGPERTHRTELRHGRLRQHDKVRLDGRYGIEQTAKGFIGILPGTGLEAAGRIALHQRNSKMHRTGRADGRLVAHHPVPDAETSQYEEKRESRLSYLNQTANPPGTTPGLHTCPHHRGKDAHKQSGENAVQENHKRRNQIYAAESRRCGERWHSGKCRAQMVPCEPAEERRAQIFQRGPYYSLRENASYGRKPAHLATFAPEKRRQPAIRRKI